MVFEALCQGLGYSSSAGHVTTMSKVLCLIPSTTKKKIENKNQSGLKKMKFNHNLFLETIKYPATIKFN